MTALLEFKQKLKSFYGQYDIYFQPLFKFVLALVYFLWINKNMGYMAQLNNVFILLIFALISCILPSGVMVFLGYLLMLGHSYALGLEAAGFMLVLILFMMIMFLRFSAGKNTILVLTPLSFAFNVPVLLPIGSGLLSGALAAFPAGCGVILYYFVRLLRAQSQTLQSPDIEMVQKLTILTDGMVQNWEMWLNVAAFVLVVLLVYLIRTRSFDYAWRISIIVGGVAYVLIMLAGSFYFGVAISVIPLIIYTVVAVLVGVVLEFFVFGGDYTRTERLQYEDDEYFYYVKAVPKAAVATSERSIKKINAEPIRESEPVVSYSKPIFQKEEKMPRQKSAKPGQKAKSAKPVQQPGTAKPAQPDKRQSAMPIVRKAGMEDFDFEKKLEESLKDL